MKKSLMTTFNHIFIYGLIYAVIFSADITNTAFAASKKTQPKIMQSKTVHDKMPKVKEENTVFYINTEWWESFNDSKLSEYMDKVFSNNHDLKIAHLKIKEGEQIVKQSIADELPAVQLSGNIERIMRESEQQFGKDMVIPPFSQTNLAFPINASYELDIWGMNHDKTKSAKKQLDIIKEQEHAYYLSISSNFASSYYNIVKCDKNIEITKELVALQKTMFKLTNKKFEAGKCSVSEVIAQEKNLKYFEEDLSTLLKERKILENELKTVMADSSIQSIDNMANTLIPSIPVPNQLSSDVIESRPDYVMAEDNLKKAGLDVKVAKKNLLPRIVIFGQAGFSAYELKNLFNTKSILASFGAAPVVDIFSGGRKMAYLKFKKFSYEEAVENYQKVILTSLKEVNDTLQSAKTNKENSINTEKRLELENKNLIIANKRFEAGYGTIPEVIQAKEIYLISQKEKINYEANSLISALSLYKATGGVNLFKIEKL